MRKALVKNGWVINVIETGADYTPEAGHEAIEITQENMRASIGWGYDNGSFIDPESLKTVDELRNEKKAAISALREQKYGQGFTYQGKIYQCNLEAQKDMTAIMLQFALGNTNPHGGEWRTVDNEAVAMDDTQVQAFIQGVFAHVYGIKNAAWTHKDNLENINDRETLVSYDITEGW